MCKGISLWKPNDSALWIFLNIDVFGNPDPLPANVIFTLQVDLPINYVQKIQDTHHECLQSCREPVGGAWPAAPAQVIWTPQTGCGTGSCYFLQRFHSWLTLLCRSFSLLWLVSAPDACSVIVITTQRYRPLSWGTLVLISKTHIFQDVGLFLQVRSLELHMQMNVTKSQLLPLWSRASFQTC